MIWDIEISVCPSACVEYRAGLNITEDRDVYPPSDDSILLIGALNIRKGLRVLEIGCGSGIVSLHCALEGADVTCGDINPKAVALTKRNAERNNIKLNVLETNVYSNIDGRFDLIVFNLPYLPVNEEGSLARAWSGGADGIGPLPRLLDRAPEHLLPDGKVIVVISSLMNPNKLKETIGDRPVKVLKELSLFFEKLQVLEISFRSQANAAEIRNEAVQSLCNALHHLPFLSLRIGNIRDRDHMASRTVGGLDA